MLLFEFNLSLAVPLTRLININKHDTAHCEITDTLVTDVLSLCTAYCAQMKHTRLHNNASLKYRKTFSCLQLGISYDLLTLLSSAKLDSKVRSLIRPIPQQPYSQFILPFVCVYPTLASVIS